MTAKFGDFFPAELKESFSTSSIKAGSVFRLHVTETNPPKIKRFVVIGVDNNFMSAGIIFINSEISEFIKTSGELSGLQFEIKKEDAEFLDHDSYLDCAQLYEIDVERLREEVKNDIGKCLGELSKDQLKKAKKLVASARTVENKLKRKYYII